MIKKETISFAENATDLISLSLVKSHLDAIRTDQDDLITDILEAAFDWASGEIGFNIRKSTVDYYFDRNEPSDITTNLALRGGLRIPAHVVSLSSVHYRSATGEQTMSASDYSFGNNQYIPCIKIINQPDDFADDGHGYRVRVVEGYSNSATNQHDKLPDVIKQAVLMKCRDLYDYRGQEIIGTITSTLSTVAADYLRKYSKLMIV